MDTKQETKHTPVNAEQALFEEAAYAQYFLSTITRNPNPPQPRISGCMDFVATATKTKVEFCAKNSDGVYVEESLNPAWWAWQKRAGITRNAHDELVRRALDVLEGLEGKELDGAMPVRIEKLRAALAAAGAA
jgi:hypothetical protein